MPSPSRGVHYSLLSDCLCAEAHSDALINVLIQDIQISSHHSPDVTYLRLSLVHGPVIANRISLPSPAHHLSSPQDPRPQKNPNKLLGATAARIISRCSPRRCVINYRRRRNLWLQRTNRMRSSEILPYLYFGWRGWMTKNDISLDNYSWQKGCCLGRESQIVMVSLLNTAK